MQNDSKNMDFLRAASDLAFQNPFLIDTQQNFLKLRGRAAESSQVHSIWDEIQGTLETCFVNLKIKDHSALSQFGDEDQRIIKTAKLFEVYLVHRVEIDTYIKMSLESKKSTTKPKFCLPIIDKLERFGFSTEEIDKYLAIYFQLRRLYYLIKKTVVGSSDSIAELRGHLWRSICTNNPRFYEKFIWDRMQDFSTLVLGETGTGKGVVARIMGLSTFIPFDRLKMTYREDFTDSLVSINLSEFPSTLIESELFGHCKGAFTGAINNRKGVFGRCGSYGAIFLDELGDIDLSIQVKLLRVLQDRTFMPVGSQETSSFSGRVIAATHQNIDKLRLEGRFRSDLFYRICSNIIELPSLHRRISENKSELELLTNSIIRRAVGFDAPELQDYVLTRITETVPLGYAWPGNIRELEQCVRSILIQNSYKGFKSTSQESDDLLSDKIKNGSLSLGELTNHYAQILFEIEGSYEGVARRLGCDRRTAKKFINEAS